MPSRPLSKEEIDLVISMFFGKYKWRDRCLFILGINTGFRISELLSLKVKDVLKSEKPLDISNEIRVQRKNMKGKDVSRSCVLNKQAKEAIETYFDKWKRIFGCKIEGRMFLFRSAKKNKNGEKVIRRMSANVILKMAYQKAKLEGKLSTHSMRKTFARKIYERSDKDIAKVQAAIGHKNINSTASYIRDFTRKEIDDLILKEDE